MATVSGSLDRLVALREMTVLSGHETMAKMLQEVVATAENTFSEVGEGA
jgi:uncharacterized membrane-anchored protein